MRKVRSNIDMVEPLKFWRAKRGFTQSKLSKLSGTSALTIGQLESGRRKARGKTLGKILQAFNLNAEDFFAMREGFGPAALPAETAAPLLKPLEISRPVSTAKEGQTLRLSNLDLELLNRILNLDFNAKVETLKFLQELA